MNDKLKPCPFCGETVVVREYGADGYSYQTQYSTECANSDCPLGGATYKDEEEAIAAWNSRSNEDALRARVAELEAQWVDAPFATLIAAIWFVRKHATGSVELVLKLDEAEAWLTAHAPKKERHP